MSTADRSMDREAPSRPAEGTSASQFTRLASMFTAPGRTFSELARTPTVAVVLIALALAGAVTATAVSRASDLDAMTQYAWEQQQENMPGSFARNMSDADRARALDAMQTGIRLSRNFAPVLGALGGVIVPMLVAGVLLLIFGILGSLGSFRTILSTVAHAGWPPAAVSALATCAVVWLSHPMAPARAGEPLRASLAGLLPGVEGWAAALLSRFEVFLGWELVLLTIGFAITLGISRGRALAVAVGLWTLGTGAAVGFALLSNFFSVGVTAGPG